VTSSKVRTIVVMDTMVSIRTVGRDDPDAVERAFGWFHRIESACSRFDRNSEVQRLVTCVGEPVVVSDILFATTQFALAVAAETDGAFDPTVGRRMERLGFDREYRTGERIASSVGDDGRVSYRDVHADNDSRTLMLDKPIVLDLGAVAKGFAIDMAARELHAIENFAIDAGGDLYLSGHNEHDAPWTVGVRDPRDPNATIAVLEASNAAVCTSGDYLRRNDDGAHHIIDPRTGTPTDEILSATVSAPLAMVADGLGTAAFVLGAERGIALLERHGVEGLLVTSTLEHHRTRGAQQVLSNA
jgi:thiamine biosynthesis lipoprotein